MIEALLLGGQRDEAAQIAADNHHWGLAFMLASVCSPTKYQSITRSYADLHFPIAAPLHLLSMVYSNQAINMLQHGGKSFLKPLNGMAVPTTKQSPGDNSSTSEKIWRRNLAALVSNKSGDWQGVLRHFGGKLEVDHGDVNAAHFAYLCGCALPVAPSTGPVPGFAPGRYTLLGCDFNNSIHRSISDALAVSAFRMTEIFEWTLAAGLEAAAAVKTANSAPAASAVGSAVSGLFGLLSFGSSNNVVNSTKEAVVPSVGALNPDWILISPQDFVMLQAFLCPVKLQFAQTLADFGLINEALAYAKEIRRLMKTLESKGTLPP